MAVEASDTVRVPRPLQNIQEELIQDGFVAASACDKHPCSGILLAPT